MAPEHRGDDLAPTQREIVLAVTLSLGDRPILPRVTDIEALERDGAPAAGAREIDLGVECQQSRREIAAESRETDAAALWRYVADVARGLETMIVGAAPPFALVVVEAARVEAQIAAERSHIPMRGSRDEPSGLRHHRIVPHHLFMGGKLGELDRRADLKRARIGPNGAQLLDVVDIDEYRRGNDAAPDIDDQVGAAAQQAALGMARARFDHLIERCRPQQRKLRQRVHQAQSASSLPGLSLMFACAASALSARRRFSSAANTRSGVTGRVLNRTPMASAMALVSAGKKAASEPSPASLAPNGPCGSFLSIIPTSIGGESWIVGTR